MSLQKILLKNWLILILSLSHTHHNSTMFKKNHWSGSQSQRMHIFWANWPRAFVLVWGRGFDYGYFWQCFVSHYNKVFKLKKKFYRELWDISGYNFRPNWDQIAGFFFIREGNNESSLAKNSLSHHQERFPLPLVDTHTKFSTIFLPSVKYEFPWFNPMKALFLFF